MKTLGKMAPELRKAQGAVINNAKGQIEGSLNARREELANEKMQVRLNAEAIDVTLPGKRKRQGRHSSRYENMGKNRTDFRFDRF